MLDTKILGSIPSQHLGFFFQTKVCRPGKPKQFMWLLKGSRLWDKKVRYVPVGRELHYSPLHRSGRNRDLPEALLVAHALWLSTPNREHASRAPTTSSGFPEKLVPDQETTKRSHPSSCHTHRIRIEKAEPKSREDPLGLPQGRWNISLSEAGSSGDRTGSDAREFRLAGAQRRV